jgi:hypothetical protein
MIQPEMQIRLGPEAMAGAIRKGAGLAAREPIGRSSPLPADARQGAAQAGWRKLPDLLGFAEAARSYTTSSRLEFARFRQANPILRYDLIRWPRFGGFVRSSR